MTTRSHRAAARRLVWMLTLLPGFALPFAQAREKAKPYKVVTVLATWGSVHGTCTIEKAVEIPKVEVRDHGKKIMRPSRRIAFDPKTRGLSSCVVWLVNVEAGKPWPKDKSAVLAHKDLDYAPHVQWLPVGSQLELATLDDHGDTFHCYEGEGRSATKFNFCLGKQARLPDAADAYFEKAGYFHIHSDLCEWKSAHLFVVEHPYYSRPTTTSGAYAIDAIPPGTYEIVCWHEGMQHKEIRSKDGILQRYDYGPSIRIREKLTVGKNERVKLDFTIPAP